MIIVYYALKFQTRIQDVLDDVGYGILFDYDILFPLKPDYLSYQPH